MIDWLNKNSGAIQAITTAVLVIITIVYAWYTKRIVDVTVLHEAKRNQPKVLAYVDSDEDYRSFVYLVIGNFGNSIAKNLKFKIKNDFELLVSGKKLSSLRPIAKGIKYLTPGRILRIPIVFLIGKVDEFSKKDTALEINYEDGLGNGFSESCDLDFNALVEYKIGERPIKQIEKHIENISKSLKNIVDKK